MTLYKITSKLHSISIHFMLLMMILKLFYVLSIVPLIDLYGMIQNCLTMKSIIIFKIFDNIIYCVVVCLFTFHLKTAVSLKTTSFSCKHVIISSFFIHLNKSNMIVELNRLSVICSLNLKTVE